MFPNSVYYLINEDQYWYDVLELEHNKCSLVGTTEGKGCSFFVLQTAYEQVKEAKEAARDLFKSVTRKLVDEAPCKSQKLSLIRKVRSQIVSRNANIPYS